MNEATGHNYMNQKLQPLMFQRHMFIVLVCFCFPNPELSCRSVNLFACSSVRMLGHADPGGYIIAINIINIIITITIVLIIIVIMLIGIIAIITIVTTISVIILTIATTSTIIVIIMSIILISITINNITTLTMITLTLTLKLANFDSVKLFPLTGADV